ncbi:hypothetical protein ACHQM5_000160 [Ranunculus cassubicifolius]
MEAEIETKISKTVISILKSSNMDEMTEFKVRKLAGEQLGLDLSSSIYKKFIRNIVESFLISNQHNDDDPVPDQDPDPEIKQVEEEEKIEPEKQQSDEEEEFEEPTTKKQKEKEKEEFFGGGKEYDDEGNLIICSLSNKRRVTIQEFKGKTLVSIREYYEKDGKQRPSNKGISLTAEQWATFRKSVPAIEESIKKMESRLG